jgi:hypothetical protein
VMHHLSRPSKMCTNNTRQSWPTRLIWNHVTKLKKDSLLWCLQVVPNTWRMALLAKTNGVQSWGNSKKNMITCQGLIITRNTKQWTHKTR